MDLARSKYYLLRWRFDYLSRPAVFGMWSNPGNIQQSGAWRQNREGVLRASVEAKDYFTRAITVLAECPGQDFVNFEWLALASLNPFGVRGSITPLTKLGGLAIRSRNELIQVYTSGEVSRTPWQDDGVQLATFGK